MGAVVLKTEIPGPRSKALLEDRKRFVSAAVSVHPSGIFVERASGALLTDVDGNVLIDLGGGIGCMNAGHGAPEVVEAVKSQADRFQHTCFMTAMYAPYVDLAGKLAAITPGSHPKKTAFFNSGAEAVENAIKFARAYTKRPAVVAFQNGFHGRTLLTMTLTSKYLPYKAGFGPFAPEVYLFPGPYPYRRPDGLSEDAYAEDAIRRWRAFFKAVASPDHTAAVIMEPVQGEGGFIVFPEAFVREVASFCRDHGIVFIADEVQSGFARTGAMFACEHFGVVPDLITMAKSLSNGLPLGAVTGRTEIMDAPQPGGIGGTFGGNPLSCAAALAAIRVIEEQDLCGRARALGERVRTRLDHLAGRLPIIGEVRGLGAMVAAEIVRDRRSREPFKEAVDRVIAGAARRGVLTLSAGIFGNVLRFLAPLVITDAQIDEAMGVISDELARIS